jgi:DNA-binding MarR family transcriptional regulator
MLLIEVTDTGRKVADSFRPIVHEHQKLWLESLGDKGQQRLIASLQQLQANLTDPEVWNGQGAHQ